MSDLATVTSADIGVEAHELVGRLYPIPRSLTGDGVRRTLAVLAELVPLEQHEVPSGTQVLDWTVPPEWNLREAWIADASGRRVVDVADHGLHIVGYSTPIDARITLDELRPHLHTLPEQPDLIPYRASYYKEDWGFCLRHHDLEALEEGDYHVVIDATLGPGHLTYGEYLVPGASDEEMLVSAHICHPQLANDNQSSVALAALLARELSGRENRISYRFVFVPGTIGAITWLARNEGQLDRIAHGLVLAGTGDAGGLHYKRSRRGDTPIDRAAEHVLRVAGRGDAIEDFWPWGYDERQYCSPGFDLPVGCLMRTPHGQYAEYHTSGDNLALVRPDGLADTYAALLDIIDVLEHDGRWRNLSPKGEPQLGRRGLYGAGPYAVRKEAELAMLWVLNLSDGETSLLDVALRSGIAFALVREAAESLAAAGLLEPS